MNRERTYPSPARQNAAPNAPLRILVVDDDRRVREAFRNILAPDSDPERPEIAAVMPGLPGAGAPVKGGPFHLTLADSGTSGLTAVTEAVHRNRPYALAIVDMRMPGMAGTETVKRIWEVDPAVKIVVVTAYNDLSPEAIVQATGRSDLAYLKKPLFPDELRQMARLLCGQWRLERRRATSPKGLPICSFCKNIRNEQDRWEPVDHYLAKHTTIRFSHSVCPICMQKHYPEFTS